MKRTQIYGAKFKFMFNTLGLSLKLKDYAVLINICDPKFTGFFAIQSVPSKISGSQNFVLSGVSGDLGVRYDVDFNFDTSFGETVVGTSITGFDYYKYTKK